MFVSESRRFRSAEFLQLHREPFWLKVIRPERAHLLISALFDASVVNQFARIGSAKCIVLVAGRGRIGDLAIVRQTLKGVLVQGVLGIVPFGTVIFKKGFLKNIFRKN